MGIPGPEKIGRPIDRRSRLSDRLASLESQIEKLTVILSEQAESRRRRRRQLTIRSLMFLLVICAIFFSWFASIYHQSRRQAAAVDRLLSQSVFVLYESRKSPLVSLLPGDPRQPPATFVDWLGEDFFRTVTNVSTGIKTATARDKNEIIESLASLDQLQRLRLTRLPWKTSELHGLGQLQQLQSIDLSHAVLDHGAIPWVRHLELRWFNASHTHLSDRAMIDLSNCDQLQELYLERTSISDAGLKRLASLKQLRYLNVKRCPVSVAVVKQLSDALPNCVIDYEPLRFLANGQVDGRAAAGGRKRFGQRMPIDPRQGRRAAAPIDQAPVPVERLNSGPYFPSYRGQSPYGRGFLIDVF